MSYDPFVIPFCAGAIILFIILIYKYTYWIVTLSKADSFKLLKGFSVLTFLKPLKKLSKKVCFTEEFLR